MEDRNLILNAQQFTFMKQHHLDIEISSLANYLSHHLSSSTTEANIIPVLRSSAEYKALFGDMSWDDAYERYEDTPGFKLIELEDELDPSLDLLSMLTLTLEELKRLRRQINNASENVDENEAP